MKIAFVHPDLGLGGAERLIVNAALSLKNLGHDVSIYTAHHDKTRAFEETLNKDQLGSQVYVYGDYLPRHIFGRFHVVAMFYMARSQFIDVIICDQVSHIVPLLKLSGAPVLFYCHYPDKLLCVDRSFWLKRIYRKPIDWLEELTTSAASCVLVNSEYTAQVFSESFPSISKSTSVLYPAIELQQFDRTLSTDEIDNLGLDKSLMNHLQKDICLLSINRFERKKNLELAIRALYQLLQDPELESIRNRIYLILAGGFDKRLRENIEYFQELQELTTGLQVSDHTFFVRSFTDNQRLFLLQNCRCVVYTPSNEHFGIVPIEAMYAERPVVAVNSGGPLESIIDGETGYLVEPTPEFFSRALKGVILDKDHAVNLGKKGKIHVGEKFSLETFGKSLEGTICQLHEQHKKNQTDRFYIICLFAVLISFCLALYL